MLETKYKPFFIPDTFLEFVEMAPITVGDEYTTTLEAAPHQIEWFSSIPEDESYAVVGSRGSGISTMFMLYSIYTCLKHPKREVCFAISALNHYWYKSMKNHTIEVIGLMGIPYKNISPDRSEVTFINGSRLKLISRVTCDYFIGRRFDEVVITDIKFSDPRDFDTLPYATNTIKVGESLEVWESCHHIINHMRMQMIDTRLKKYDPLGVIDE